MPRTISAKELRAAVALAVHAPSIHNTQPWRWHVEETGLQLRLDPRRVLPATDPDGHSAELSCGAALRLARICMESQGWGCLIEYCPDDNHSDLLATLRATDRRAPTARDRALAAGAPSRVSDHRLLDARGIAEDRLEPLRRGGGGSDAFVQLVRPSGTDRALWLTVLTSHATADEHADPAQAAELRHWVREGEPAADGVPAWAESQTVGGGRHSNVPQRDFATPGHEDVPIHGGVDDHPAFAIVQTPSDSRREHVLAGEVMMQLMLEAWFMGIASCPVSQAVDHVTGRIRLGQALGGIAIPQMILRLGIPTSPRPASGDPPPSG